MLNIEMTIMVSLLLFVFILVGKSARNPILLLVSYVAAGGYWFWLLHKAWLELMALATGGR